MKQMLWVLLGILAGLVGSVLIVVWGVLLGKFTIFMMGL